MTVRAALLSTGSKLKALSLGPPWYVRLLGGAILSLDVVWWLREHAPTTKWEVVKHSILLLVGLSLFAPEAADRILRFAGRVMRFARQVIPLLDRRKSRRPKGD